MRMNNDGEDELDDSDDSNNVIAIEPEQEEQHDNNSEPIKHGLAVAEENDSEAPEEFNSSIQQVVCSYCNHHVVTLIGTQTITERKKTRLILWCLCEHCGLLILYDPLARIVLNPSSYPINKKKSKKVKEGVRYVG